MSQWSWSTWCPVMQLSCGRRMTFSATKSAGCILKRTPGVHMEHFGSKAHVRFCSPRRSTFHGWVYGSSLISSSRIGFSGRSSVTRAHAGSVGSLIGSNGRCVGVLGACLYILLTVNLAGVRLSTLKKTRDPDLHTHYSSNLPASSRNVSMWKPADMHPPAGCSEMTHGAHGSRPRSPGIRKPHMPSSETRAVFCLSANWQALGPRIRACAGLV